MDAGKELGMAIRKALEDFRKSTPEMSLRAVAAYSGANRYFLTKILDGNSEDLDLNQFLKLSRFLATHSDSEAKSYREMRETINRIFDMDFLDESKKSVPDIYGKEEDLYEKNIYFALVLASYRLPQGDTPFSIQGNSRRFWRRSFRGATEERTRL